MSRIVFYMTTIYQADGEPNSGAAQYTGPFKSEWKLRRADIMNVDTVSPSSVPALSRMITDIPLGSFSIGNDGNSYYSLSYKQVLSYIERQYDRFRKEISQLDITKFASVSERKYLSRLLFDDYNMLIVTDRINQPICVDEWVLWLYKFAHKYKFDTNPDKILCIMRIDQIWTY